MQNEVGKYSSRNVSDLTILCCSPLYGSHSTGLSSDEEFGVRAAARGIFQLTADTPSSCENRESKR